MLQLGFAPLPKFLGIEIGQSLDVQHEATRKAYGLKPPALIVEAKDGFRYWQCDSIAPKDGFESFSVDVTLSNTVFRVEADVSCRDWAETKKKREEIVEDLKKRFKGRFCENGDIEARVSCGTNFVEVCIEKKRN